jgi:hypothetical protein
MTLVTLFSKKLSKRFLVFALPVLFLGTLIGLMIGEVIVRKSNADWRYAQKTLYFQQVDAAAHQADSDPKIFFRLKPGQHTFLGHTVTVNQFGERGPWRSETKPAGVYRIFCFGGSNVYGAGIDDGRTWPAELEAELNRTHKSQIEVWNFGVSAYSGYQMAGLADRMVAQLKPDLVILAISNQDMPAVIGGAQLREAFEREPMLWLQMVIDPRFDRLPDFAQRVLLKRSALYRQALLFLTETRGTRSFNLGHHEKNNIQAIRQFVLKYKDDFRIGVFFAPAVAGERCYTPYYEGLNVPVYHLSGNGQPDDFSLLHPLAHVTPWYGKNLADWLNRDFILPE